MKKIIARVLQTPLPVLAAVAFSRLERRWASAAQRMRLRPQARPASARIREDREFFCASDMRDNRAHFLSLFLDRWNDSPNRAVEEADKAVAHMFDLLGSGEVFLGDTIDWHRDFKSGKAWPRHYFEDIPEIDLSDGSDIKVPWELSRFYHFISLGKGYLFTGSERYTREFLDQLSDWLEKNPFLYGVNWHCPMEVAIRAINLLWAYFFFRDSPLFDEDRKRALAASLLDHGRFIRGNLEFDRRVVDGRLQRMNGNHYMADLVGLVYLGVMLDGREPEAWLSFALSELESELEVQVLPDGAHWELAPAYHRLVLEMLLGCGVLCSSNGIPLPKRMVAALDAMTAFLEGYLRPDGTGPLARDADDGRVTPLGPTDYRDHRHLLAPAALFCGRKELPHSALATGEDLVWLFGSAGLNRALALPHAPPGSSSRAFPDAGYYALHSGQDVKVFVVCANGGMNGRHAGHAHNDALSFELFWKNTAFLSDSGTFIYSGSPRWRNLFRSTAFHNTARVDGVEINRFSESILFAMENDARPLVTLWKSSPTADRLAAEHYGYRRLPRPVVHKREFLLDKGSNTLAVEDSFAGEGEHLFEIFLTVHPDCRLDSLGPSLVKLSRAGAVLFISFADLGDWKLAVTEGWVSERYGRKRETRKLVISRRGGLPCALGTRFICAESPVGEPGGVPR
jgi:hypothetical protein